MEPSNIFENRIRLFVFIFIQQSMLFGQKKENNNSIVWLAPHNIRWILFLANPCYVVDRIFFPWRFHSLWISYSNAWLLRVYRFYKMVCLPQTKSIILALENIIRRRWIRQFYHIKRITCRHFARFFRYINVRMRIRNLEHANSSVYQTHTHSHSCTHLNIYTLTHPQSHVTSYIA